MDPEEGVPISDILNSLSSVSSLEEILCNEKSTFDDLEQHTLGGGFPSNCYSVNVDKEVEIINCQQSFSGEQRPVSTVRQETASSAYLSPQCVSGAPSVSRASSVVCGQSPIPVGYPHSQLYAASTNGFVPPSIHSGCLFGAQQQQQMRPLVQPQAAYASNFVSAAQCQPPGQPMATDAPLLLSSNGVGVNGQSQYQAALMPPYQLAQGAPTPFHAPTATFQLAQNGQSAFQPTQPFIMQQSYAGSQTNSPNGRPIASPHRPAALAECVYQVRQTASNAGDQPMNNNAQPGPFSAYAQASFHQSSSNSQQGPNAPTPTPMHHFSARTTPVPPANSLLMQHQTQTQPAICPLPPIESSYSRNPAIVARYSPASSFAQPVSAIDVNTTINANYIAPSVPPLAQIQQFDSPLSNSAPQYIQMNAMTNEYDCDVKVKPSTNGVSPIDSQAENRQTAPSAGNCAQPTAKNLLKSRLVERFMQRGEDPHVEEKKPSPPVNTPEVEQIRQKRRERNRDAARRTRHNKRRRMMELEEQIAQLVTDNKKQEEEWRRLSNILGGLRNRCMNHLIKVKDCPHEAAMRRLVTANLESDCTEFGDSIGDDPEPAD